MIKKAVFKINGMHCTSCAFDIDGMLEDADGVIESNTNYAKSQTEVTFDPAKVSTNKIVQIISNAGYEANCQKSS